MDERDYKAMNEELNQPSCLGAVSGSLPISVASIRSNFEMWKNGEIKDGVFAWHLQNNLLRIEKELAGNNR